MADAEISALFPKEDLQFIVRYVVKYLANGGRVLTDDQKDDLNKTFERILAEPVSLSDPIDEAKLADLVNNNLAQARADLPFLRSPKTKKRYPKDVVDELMGFLNDKSGLSELLVVPEVSELSYAATDALYTLTESFDGPVLQPWLEGFGIAKSDYQHCGSWLGTFLVKMSEVRNAYILERHLDNVNLIELGEGHDGENNISVNSTDGMIARKQDQRGDVVEKAIFGDWNAEQGDTVSDPISGRHTKITTAEDTEMGECSRTGTATGGVANEDSYSKTPDGSPTKRKRSTDEENIAGLLKKPRSKDLLGS